MVVDGVSDERYATQRGSQLARTTDLGRKAAEAIAWSEKGYSRSAIASRMDSTAGTIKDYHERAMAMYGFEILEEHVAEGDGLPEYDRVDADYLEESGRTRDELKDWVRMVLNNEGRLEVEMTNTVRDQAQDRRLVEMQ